MICFKKYFASFLFLLCGINFFAEENKISGKIKLNDKISSDIVEIKYGEYFDEKADTSEVYFAGLKNKLTFEYESEKISALMKIVFKMKNFKDPDEEVLYFTASESDYFVEYRPFEFLGLGFHEKVWTPGAYLPVWDDYVMAGNMGSTGFTLLVKPLDGLRISASVPVSIGGINILNGDKDKTYNKGKYQGSVFEVNAGLDYSFKYGSLGFAIQDLADNDERSFGFFASGKPFDNFVLNVGYSNYKLTDEDLMVNPYYKTVGIVASDLTGDYSIRGKDILTLGTSWKYEDVTLSGDFAMNFDTSDSLYDAYGAFWLEYVLSEKFTSWLEGLVMIDNNKDTEYMPLIGIQPGLEVGLGRCTLKFAISMEFVDDDFFVSFPVSAKFKLN